AVATDSQSISDNKAVEALVVDAASAATPTTSNMEIEVTPADFTAAAVSTTATVVSNSNMDIEAPINGSHDNNMDIEASIASYAMLAVPTSAMLAVEASSLSTATPATSTSNINIEAPVSSTAMPTASTSTASATNVSVSSTAIPITSTSTAPTTEAPVAHTPTAVAPGSPSASNDKLAEEKASIIDGAKLESFGITQEDVVKLVSIGYPVPRLEELNTATYTQVKVEVLRKRFRACLGKGSVPVDLVANMGSKKASVQSKTGILLRKRK
ncbi:hypothetical protein GGI20_004441, partial [Coemansia sp. BCRC 34301]